MARLVYSLVLYLISPLIFLHLWLRGKKAPDYRKRWRERLAFYNQNLQPNSLVVHCASVGELMAAAKMIKALQEKYVLTITCNTPTGSSEIKKQFGDSVQHLYLPLDFPGSVSRFLAKLQPRAIVILETELWPNLIIKANQQTIPVCVINARLSEKSLKGYQKIAPLSRQIMTNIQLLAAHNKQDAERFCLLGLAPEKVQVTGSIKFDIQIDSKIQQKIAHIKTQISHHSFIWVAGSTHPGEHEQVIAAHCELLKHDPNALLIIAPRHPEQFEKVASYLTQHNLAFSQRSKHSHSQQNIMLADTMGEMLALFGAANCAFIGGSLIERGGHNPLEAAAFNLPILTGPSYTNFLHVYPQLLANQACLCINSSTELSEKLIQLNSDTTQAEQLGNNAYAILDMNRGALARTLALIDKEISK